MDSTNSIPEFVKIQAEAFQSFNVDNAEKELDRGVWYPTEYFDALQAAPEQKQAALKQKDVSTITWLKSNNICWSGYLNKKSFEPVVNRSFTFVIKSDAVASEALKQLTKGLTFLECATALQLSQWVALRDYIGPQNFNTLLSLPRKEFPPMYFQSGGCILSQLYQPVVIQGEEDILPGDICYFKNSSQYSYKHPFGLATGYNTVCVDRLSKNNEPKFMGFGLSVNGNSSSEIESQLFEEYNKEPVDPSIYLTDQKAQKVASSSTKKTLTWKEFQQESSQDHNGVRGRLVLKVQRLRLDRMEQLKTTPSNQIRKLVATWR